MFGDLVDTEAAPYRDPRELVGGGLVVTLGLQSGVRQMGSIRQRLEALLPRRGSASSGVDPFSVYSTLEIDASGAVLGARSLTGPPAVRRCLDDALSTLHFDPTAMTSTVMLRFQPAH